MEQLKLVATSAMGLESIVADEVKALGFETTTENGKIYFQVEIVNYVFKIKFQENYFQNLI